MASKKESTVPSRSQFIRDYIQNNPIGKFEDIVDAWVEAGYPKDKMPTKTLYYQVKPRKGKKRKKTVKDDATVQTTDNSYLKFEKALEQLVQEAESMSDKKLAEAIRQARRVASSKLV